MAYEPSPVITQEFAAGAINIFAVGPKTGIRPVVFTGCGGGGAGGGGSGSGGGVGVGGGAGGASMYGEFTVMVDFSHRIDVIIPVALPTGGTAGGIGVDGGRGQDGGGHYVLDFTTSTVLCAFASGSGGNGGSLTNGPGIGGANFPNSQAGSVLTANAGFLAAGGIGGAAPATSASSGNFNLTTFGLTPPALSYVPGVAGVSGGGTNGSGGGGGGQGPYGNGGDGGNGNATTGTPGVTPPANSGAGGGGGAGGATGAGAHAGSLGGAGSIGQITYKYRS